MAESVSVPTSCDNNNVQPNFLSDVKRPDAAEIPSNIHVTSEGKNGQQIKCQRCPSTILLPEMATLVTAEFNLPAMSKDNEQNEDSKQFWCADNMYAFENVGFSKTVDGVKYLICADCEIGPIGAAVGLKSKGIGAAVDRKKLLPVETDPERLVNFVCGSNIYKEGEDVKLKDDSEYPDWLWQLRLGPPPDLDEMVPDTKEYWEAVELRQKIRWLRLKKPKTKKKMFVNETDKIEKLKALRFRALAYQYDPGYEKPPKFDKDMWKIT